MIVYCSNETDTNESNSDTKENDISSNLSDSDILDASEDAVNSAESVVLGKDDYEPKTTFNGLSIDLKSYFGYVQKAQSDYNSEVEGFEDNSSEFVQCKQLRAQYQNESIVYSNWYVELYKLMDAMKLDCFSLETEYYVYKHELETTLYSRINDAKDLIFNIDKCTESFTENQVGLLAIQKKCQDPDVVNSLSNYISIRDTFFTLRSELNQKEMEFQKINEQYKENNEHCLNPSNSRFKHKIRQNSNYKPKLAKSGYSSSKIYSNQNSDQDLDKIIEKLNRSYFKSNLINTKNENTNENYRFNQKLKLKQKIKSQLKTNLLAKQEVECETCHKIPENIAYMDIEKFYLQYTQINKVLEHMSADLKNYNSKANLEMEQCENVKNSLSEIVYKNSDIEKKYREWQQKWASCTRQDFNSKINLIQFDIQTNYKLLSDLDAEFYGKQAKFDFTQCTKLVKDELEIVSKGIKECEKNASTIESLIESTKRYFDVESIKVKDKITKNSVLIAKQSDKNNKFTGECNKKMSCKIGQDNLKTSGQRFKCTAMLNDIKPETECFYEHISDLDESDSSYSVVRVDNTSYRCKTPRNGIDSNATAGKEEKDSSTSRWPVINILDPFNCLPCGSSGYKPYICNIGAELFTTDYSDFNEYDGVGCIEEEGFNFCNKVKYVDELNTQGYFLVRDTKKEVSSEYPFYKCKSHSSEGVEVKFDFTDREFCERCDPFDIEKPYLDKEFVKPTLKSEEDKDIMQYQTDYINPKTSNKVPCYFYLDKNSLRQYSNIYGVKSTKQDGTYNENTASLQRRGSVFCEVDEETKKVKVFVEQDEYSFTSRNKQELEQIVSNYDVEVKKESVSNPNNRKYSDHMCLIIKILMNKSNINSGIELKRVDWSKAQSSVWKFSDYWDIQKLELWQTDRKYSANYTYLDSDQDAAERKAIYDECRTYGWKYMTSKSEEPNQIWALLNFNYSYDGAVKIFRPSEKEQIEHMWGIKLPEVQPFWENSQNDSIPENLPENFISMDYSFTDTHFGKSCITTEVDETKKKSRKVRKTFKLKLDDYTCNWRNGPLASEYFEKIKSAAYANLKDYYEVCVHIDDIHDKSIPEVEFKFAGETTDIYCMGLTPFLEGIKSNAANLKEDDAKDDGKGENKPKIYHEFDMEYKFKIPRYCTVMKTYVDDRVFSSCK